jgi:hypothetical protein
MIGLRVGGVLCYKPICNRLSEKNSTYAALAFFELLPPSRFHLRLDL